MTKPISRIFITKNDMVKPNENNLVDLVLENGDEYRALEPRRLFPVSRTEKYITLLNSDGEEIGIIKTLDDLNRDSREVIVSSLNDYYLVPEIRRILLISEKNGQIHWSVETERGFKEFDVKNRNHDVKVFDDGSVRVRDSDDNRYLIPDYHKLDKHSRIQLIADL